MTMEGLKSALEAVLFAAGDSVPIARLSLVIGTDESEIERAVDELAAEYEKIAKFWIELRRNDVKFYLGTIQDKLKFRLTGQRHRTTSCHVAAGIVACAANGNLFPCTRFISSKPDAPYILGNVFDEPASIFDGPVARDIRNFFDHDKEDCKGCAIRFRCHGHECACTSFYSTGSVHGVSPEVCTHERMLAAICDDAIV